jgi:membrane-associated phospholipid phosphatase
VSVASGSVLGGDDATHPVPLRRAHWWRELVSVAGFYVAYSAIRNLSRAAAGRAYANARLVIAFESGLGLSRERAVQAAFVGARWFVQFWDVYYGSAHFLVTAAVLVWLFRRHPNRYRLWRNALAAASVLALVGFVVFPLMPPRLLDDCGRFGACARYGFTDTLRRVGGLWSFESTTMAQLSNQYAAMPSLHTTWAMWCVVAMWRHVRRWWARLALAAYPLATIFAIVVTANHYLLDAVGGAVALAAGYLMAASVRRFGWGVRRAGRANRP